MPHYFAPAGLTEVTGLKDPPPLSLPGRWFTVQVACDRSFTRDEENAITRGVWDHLQGVPGQPYKVTAANPVTWQTGWNLPPWDVVRVDVQQGHMGWWAGSPAGLAPVPWVFRKQRLAVVPVYVGLTDEERRVSGVELAILRACHELYHCLTNDHGHTAAPGNMMYEDGVRIGARFDGPQLAALGRVQA